MVIGNPGQPSLLECSIVRANASWWSFRVGYLDDWVYHQKCQDEFDFEDVTETQTVLKLSTYAALLTVNFNDIVDLYGLVGSSRMQLDHEIFTKRALGWGIGTKCVLFKKGDFFLGTDLKYFETSQKPRYFVVNGLPYNIVSNYRLKYHEVQAALGVCYRAWIFAPYVNATFIYAHIEPEPAVLLVRLPDDNKLEDSQTKSIVGQNKWGIALGLTLVDCKKMSLSCEWRGINQNAIDINGEIRF